MINVERLKQVIDYDRCTGVFTWKKRSFLQFIDGGHEREHNAKKWNARYAGNTAGKIDPRTGYIYISIDGVRYAAHRLAWMYETGIWPAHEIDHIDGNSSFNAFENLRDATRGENAKNMPKNSRNTSGYVGVCICSTNGKWAAQIGVNRRVINLGRFINLADALAARRAAERKYGFHENHGRSA